jgi:acetyl esterase
MLQKFKQALDRFSMMASVSAPQAGPTASQRAVAAIAGPITAALMKAPPRVLAPLAGRRQQIDGQRLEPGLALLCRASTPIVNLALDRPTALRRAMINLFAGSMTHGAPTDVPASDIQVADTIGRLYEPPYTNNAPLLVFFHGGGFIFSSVAGEDGTCAYLASSARVRILSVEYPLAPEHPAPAAHDAAAAAWAWVVDHASDLQIDPTKIAVGGDSAGGNLAAYVAYGGHGHKRPAAAFMIYPVTDLHADDPSVHTFPTGLLLTQRGLNAIARHYDGGNRHPEAVTENPVPPDAPPAFIGVAGMDPLRDQGIRFAEHLRNAGVQVHLARYDNVVHGFATMLVVPECLRATESAADALRRLLEAA